jgi:phosphoserine phosphatase RsbU/P
LLLYTDGLTEARGSGALGSDRYGEEALRDLGSRLAPASADRAVAAIIAVLRDLGDRVDDDVAVLALGVRAPS